MPRLQSNLAQLMLYLTFELDSDPASESSNWRCDMKRKGLVLSISLVLLLVLTSVRAQAQCYYNPLFLPFAVAGAIVGTAAAIVVPGPVYPAYPGPAYYAPAPGYYGYGPRPFYYRPVWAGRHHPRHGAWGGGYRR